jgi:type I restriction enzyme S subunit
LKWAFEGKLTNENVKDGELPKHWEMVSINTVSIINPKLPNKENLDREMEVQFLPMKLVEEIVNKIHLSDIKKLHEVLKGSYTPFIDNDIIFAKVTPCMENGKIAVVEKLKNGIGFGSSEFHVVRTNEKVSNKFMFYFLVQDRFRNEAANKMTGAVGLRRVPKQFIENYQIPIASIEEQHLIVEEIESRISVADKMEESIVHSLLQAEALRQSILKKAFSGELV